MGGGRLADDETTFTFPGLAEDESEPQSLEADTLQIRSIEFPAVAASPREVRILRICWKTHRELQRERLIASGETATDGAAERSGAPVLKPNTLYRLTVETRAVVKHNGSEDTYPSDPRYFYFRTGNGPGANPEAVDFGASPLNKFDTYIAHTVPAHGATHAYYGYDLAVAFNEGYVDRMYTSPLQIRVRDRNGRLLGEPAGEQWSGLLPLLPPGLLTWRASEEAGGCAESPEPGTPTPYLGRAAPRSDGQYLMRPNRMYTAEVVTTVDGQEKLLYSFQFTTSRFSDVEAHLRSGQSEGGEQTVHALPPGPALPLDWLGTHRDLQVKLNAARDELRGALDRHELSIPEKLEAARAAFDSLHQFCQSKFAELDSVIQERFVRIGLGHRPLPPVLEFIQLPIEGTDSSALLLESPEPLDWARMTLSSSAGAVHVLWNNDQTRAFIVRDDGRWFTHGQHDFTLHYSGDQRDFPELEPVTQGTEPARAEVPCTVSVGEITLNEQTC